MTSNNAYYLTTLGIQTYQVRQPTELVVAGASDDLVSLKAQVAECQACSLCSSRTQTVFGVGSNQADLLVVGEAPGFHEDQQGEPFVGRAGQLLDAMLTAVGLARQQIYIANILKCRPPSNRDPKIEEVMQCTPYLERQIELIQPKLIVAVGRHAAHFLLARQDSLARLRGRTHQYHNTPLIVSYHPAYLLRNPRDKAKALTDWWAVAETLNLFSN